MTWYWWKHWFWITLLLILAVLISSVAPYPITPIFKDIKKDKTIRYPLDEISIDDNDNIFNGNNNGDVIPGLITLRDRENQIPGIKDKSIEQNSSVFKINNYNHENVNVSSDIFLNETTNNEKKLNNSKENENKSLNNLKKKLESTNSSKEIYNNVTKVDDFTLENSSNSSSKNINRNITGPNFLSTNASLTILNTNVSNINHKTNNESQSLKIVANSSKNESVYSAICNSTVMQNIEISEIETKFVESHKTNIGSLNNNTIDCESNISESENVDSLEDLPQNNKTTTLHVDLIEDDEDSIQINQQNNDKSNNNDNDDDNNRTLNINNSNNNIEHITKNYEENEGEEEIVRAETERQLEGERGRKSKVLAEYRHELKFINFSSDSKNLLARSATVLDFDEQDDGNISSSEALAIQKTYILDVGTISGICIAVLGLSFTITIAGVVLYRRRYLNKPQTLSEPDSSGYIDDSTIRDNSDEMYSLDNDSFLNSLEAMTIQNYWTDTVKHTKL